VTTNELVRLYHELCSNIRQDFHEKSPCPHTSVHGIYLLTKNISIETFRKSEIDMQNAVKKSARLDSIEAPPELVKEIVYQIRRLIQARELYTKELNKNYSVTAAQLNCVLALHEEGPLSASQIAKIIMVKSSTVTGIIDRLEQKGLVQRLRNSPDRRVVTIQLTAAGKTLADNAPPAIQQKILDGLTSLRETEIKRIVKSLKMITRMLDVQDLEVE
jgi:DNA-binding MarR family transcriptional regulator